MAKRTAKVPEELERRRLGRRSGYITASVRLEPEQLRALQREAMKRAAARGTLKPDASEILREAVDAWVSKRR